MVVIPEDKIVAYETPLAPHPKTKIKIGSKIKFKTFVIIRRIVGVLVFPSACKVLVKKFEKRKT